MRRLLFGLSLGLAFLSVGLVTTQSRRTDQAWEEMLILANGLQQSIDGADVHRAVLHGEALEGNAHEDYTRAVALLEPTATDDWRAWLEATEGGDGSATVLRDELLDAHRELLAALDVGARRREARYPMEWEDGFSGHVPKLLDMRTLANLTVLAAGRHLDEGHPQLAVDVLLDGQQLARDHVQSPVLIASMIGCALLSITGLEALVEEGLLERLPPPQLARLAEGMAALDGGLSMTSHASAGEIVLFVKTVQKAQSIGALLDLEPLGTLQAWRYGFSGRQMSAAFVRDSVERLAILRGSEGLPWPERKQALDSLQELIADSANPITQVVAPKLLSADEAIYGAFARHRLARAAVEARLTGEAPRLADPFGDELRVREDELTTWIESRGPDGDFSAERYRVELAP